MVNSRIKNDVKYVHQLFDNNGLKNFNEIENLVGSYGGFLLDYFAIRIAVKKSMIIEIVLIPMELKIYSQII